MAHAVLALPFALLLVMVSLVPITEVGTGAGVPGPASGPFEFGTTEALPGDPFLGRIAAPASVDVVFGLEYRNQGELDALLSSMENPRSPLYRHYLTSQQFEAQFGPTASSVSAVESYLASEGALGVTETPGGLVEASLPPSSTERIFSTQVGWYAAPEGRYYATLSSPVLPAALAGLVSGVSGLSDYSNLGLSHETSVLGRGTAAAPGGHLAEYDQIEGSPYQIFWGTDYQAIYDELPLLDAGDNGTGYAVDTLLTSGFNVTANGGSGQDLPPFDPEALRLYYAATFPSDENEPAPTGVPVTISGVTPPAPGAPPDLAGVPMTDDSGSVDENSLDLEMVQSMAPGAQVYEFYFSETLIANSLSSAASDFDVSLGQALDYNYSGDKLAAITNSWGLLDTNDSTWDGLLQKAAAMGVTVLAASGDQGDAPSSLQNHPQGQWPSFPATAAFNTSGVLAVGGTTVTVTGAPTGEWSGNQETLPPTGYDATSISGISSEAAWFYPAAQIDAYGGTEGGVSAFINEPGWQATSEAQSTIKYAAAKEGTNYARGVPDIAASGNTTLIYLAEQLMQGETYVTFEILAGTSVASPLMAGMLAVVAQDEGRPLGFISPALYAIGGYFQTHAGSDPFRSVVVGDNYLYNASEGWDALTGWGCPEADLLAPALNNQTLTTYVFNATGVAGKASGHFPGNPGTGSSAPNSVLVLLILVVAFCTVALIAVVLVRGSSRRQTVGYSGNPPPAPLPPPYGGGNLTQGSLAPGVSVCSYCHRQVTSGLGFCPYCGNWLPRP